MIRYEATSEDGRYVYHLYKSSWNGGSYSVDTSYSGTAGRDPRWVRVYASQLVYDRPSTQFAPTTAIIPGPLGLAKETADQMIAELDAEINRQDAEAVEVPAEYPDHGTVTRGIDWTHEVPGSRTGEREPMDTALILTIEGSNWHDWMHTTYRLALEVDGRTDLYVDVTRNGQKVGIRLGWAYGPSFGIRYPDLSTGTTFMKERPSVEAIQAWFSGVLRKARYLLDTYLQPIMDERANDEPCDGTDRDWEMGMSSFTQAIVDQKPTPETAAGMAGPAEADPETNDDDADPDPSPGPGGVRRQWSNRKSVAVQARAYGWSEARYRQVIGNISDRFRDPAEVAARSLIDLVELRTARTHYLNYVIPNLRFYIDIPLSELRGQGRLATAFQNEAHLTRIARLNLTRLETLIRQQAWKPAKLPAASVPDPEPILNNGSPILLYADAVRLEVTLTRGATPLLREHTGTVAPPVRGRTHIKMEVKGWHPDDAIAAPRYYGNYHYDDVTRATRDAADLLRGVATTDTGR